MAHQEKVFATNTKDLSWIRKTHTTEKTDLQLTSDFTHADVHASSK